MKHIYIFIVLLTFCYSAIFGQEIDKKEKIDTKENTLNSVKDINGTTTSGDKISFKDGTTTLLEINSEGTAGSLIFPSVGNTLNGTKLYNNNGNLYWGSTNLSSPTGGSSAIGDLSDAFTNSSSIYLGVNSLPGLTSGVNNNALGIDALKLNTSGSSNNAIGINALGLNTEGNSNEAFGNSALYRNTTGSGNIGIGNSANFNNQTGSNNTIVGYRAGFGTQLHNKSGNVFLGYNAGYNEEGSNKLYIENSNSSTPLIYGDFTDGSEQVKINGDLYSEGKAYGGNFSASNNGGVAVYAVATDANNNLFQGNTGGRFEARAGEGIGLRGIASNSGNFTNYGGFFAANGAMGRGVYATAPLTGYAGYFDGNLHVTGNITSDGSSPGASAINDLSDASTIGAANIFLGNGSGASITSGYQNAAVGPYSLQYNSTGAWNVAFGYSALSQNTVGVLNVAIGRDAMFLNTTGNNNTALGESALHENTTGSNNIGVGRLANQFNQTGSNNTIVGVEAGVGSALNSKSGNIFLGYQAGYNELGSNKLYIENSSSATPLIWGDFSTNIVNINGTQGINYSSPQTSLHIKQQASVNAIRMEYNSDADYWDTYIDSANDYNFKYNGVLKAYINDTDGSYNVASDERLKNSIQKISGALPSVLSLEPKRYKYNSDASNQEQIGFVAQDVQKLFPEAVSEKDGYLGINYAVFGVLAIEAIKEQQNKIDDLEARLARLEAAIK